MTRLTGTEMKTQFRFTRFKRGKRNIIILTFFANFIFVIVYSEFGPYFLCYIIFLTCLYVFSHEANTVHVPSIHLSNNELIITIKRCIKHSTKSVLSGELASLVLII